MKIALRILVCSSIVLLLGGAQSGVYTPFASSGLPSEASKGVLWFSNDAGKIVRTDMYGLKLKEIIETIAALSKLNVRVEECPDIFVTFGIRDDEPLIALRRLVGGHGLTISEESAGVYRVTRVRRESEN